MRLGLQGPWSGNAVAFDNPDGRIVLVINNPFDEPRPLIVAMPGGKVAAQLPAKSFNSLILKP